MKKYLISIHHPQTHEQIGMVCLPAESLNDAHAKGVDAILLHKHMGHDDIEGLLTFVKEVPSLRPAQWE